MPQQSTNQAIKDCLEICKDCHTLCEATVMYCLELGSSHAEVTLQRILHDCAQICQTSADFMLRGSSFMQAICALCGQICTQCAEACERVDAGDKQMKACADLCRRCAQSCQQMTQVRV